MKVVIAVLLIAVLVSERHRGFGRIIQIQFGILLRDMRRYLLAALVLVFGAMYLIDAQLLQAIQSIKSPMGTSLIDFGGAVGKNGTFGLACWRFYAVTKVLRFKRATVVVLLTILSSAITGLICTLVKITFLRSRPAAGFGEGSFFNVSGYLQHEGLYLSMPSGDVALVAGAAAFLFHFAPNRLSRILLAAVPLLTCASRIYLNRHWPSDTILAVGIGIIVGNYLYRAYLMRMTDYSQLPLFLRVHRPLLGFVKPRTEK